MKLIASLGLGTSNNDRLDRIYESWRRTNTRFVLFLSRLHLYAGSYAILWVWRISLGADNACHAIDLYHDQKYLFIPLIIYQQLSRLFLLFFCFYSSPIRFADKRSRDMMKETYYCDSRPFLIIMVVLLLLFSLVNRITWTSRIFYFDMR